MATARWFFTDEPNSRFVIQEHLRQDFWRNGPAALWIETTQATPPLKAVGTWHDLNFDLEWVPRDYAILRADRREKELIRATSLLLGMKPAREAEEGGRYLVEWRIHRAEAAPEETSAPTAVGVY